MDRREQDVREAKATRERLEKGSPSAGRRDFAGILNAMVADAAGREMPGLAALEAIRKGQRHGYKTAADHNWAHTKFEALQRSQATERDGFNRLYPRDKLASAPLGPERDDARDEPIGPDLAAAIRVFDTAGRLMSADPRTRDHWPGGDAKAIAAAFLFEAARAIIAAVNARARQSA